MSYHIDSCVEIAHQLLKVLTIKHTKSYLENIILSHPDHPSLLCISDALKQYSIESLALKASAVNLANFPLPCVVQVSNHGGLFHILTEFSGEKAVCINDKGMAVEKSKKDFLERWTGVCLLAEPSAASKEPGIELKLREKRTIFIFNCATVALLLSAMLLAFANNIALVNSAFLLVGVYTSLKLIGIIVSSILLWYEVDKHNPLLQGFCLNTQKINCDAVLDSKYSKFFNGTLSLGLLGFSYFFGTFLYLAISGFAQGVLSVLAYQSFIVLPVVAISAYYQAFIIKQWCTLCLTVQFVLVFEAITVFFGGFYENTISWESLFLLIGLLLLPIAAWKILKPLLEAKKEVNVYKTELKKIKNSPTVLSGLLAKTTKLTTSTKGLGISLYNEGAKYNVVKVCNPYCKPCAEAHQILEELVNTKKISLQIMFISNNDQKDSGPNPISHLLAIDAQGNKEITERALHDWYTAEKKEYQLFAKKYPMNGELGQQSPKLNAMSIWCKAESISHTPTLYINGRELPKEYSLKDFKSILMMDGTIE